jgi:fluoroquinolone resistance protein
MNETEMNGPRKEHFGLTFEGLDARNRKFTFKSFDGCTFAGCAFTATDFTGTRFLDCVFRKCDLSLVRIRDCAFVNARFEGSKIAGVNWTEASWPKKNSLNSIDFFDCVVSQSAFGGLVLKKMKLTRCTSLDADFSEADLAQSDFRGTDFSRSRFMHTDLTGADFRDAKNYVIHPALNKVSKAKFSLPEAMGLLYCLDIVIS